MSNPQVLIVGGGLAGLACARQLHGAGTEAQILEASDHVGGRVRTDVVDGFRLDRGFQILLTAYPEAQRVLDYDALNLRPFEPGALVRFQGKFHRLADPWRRPRHILASAVSPLASLGDLLRVAHLRSRVTSGPLDDLFQQPETSTLERLRQAGFSDRIIERFFRPFLGGVFLERELATSSRKLDFVFRMFATGDAVVPSQGMAAIPHQLRDGLSPEAVRTNTRVTGVSSRGVTLESGEELSSEAVVVATDQRTAAQLLGWPEPPAENRTTCLYFAADRPPLEEPILVLNGDSAGPINNLSVPSQVSASYAPQGRALVSVTVVGIPENQDALQNSVREQLANWFGAAVRDWQHLRTYSIDNALPNQSSLTPLTEQSLERDGIYICGDYLESASIHAALLSGRKTAEALCEQLSIAAS